MTIAELQAFHGRIKGLKSDIGKEPGATISKLALRKCAEDLATDWFQSVAPNLAAESGPSAETIEKHSASFARLLKLSKPNNLKSSYVDVLTAISKAFHDDLILPLQMKPKLAKEVSLLTKLFENLPTSEDQYFREAVACASHGLYRGAAVLGWCAAIDRIHRVIDGTGFARFNSTSQSMKSATSGRFKRFNKSMDVQTISDLREVFDTDVLWILEGMQMIDSNQHTRLRSCFELRCQCAHPGEAPVTEFNLLSFFSDINEIVFKNGKFTVADS